MDRMYLSAVSYCEVQRTRRSPSSVDRVCESSASTSIGTPTVDEQDDVFLCEVQGARIQSARS